MGFLEQLRRAFPSRPAPIGDARADVALVRRELQAEATRLGRRDRLSLTLLMEHSEMDLTAVDLHGALGHLEAEGEIVDVEADSFGNLRFNLGEDFGEGRRE